MLSLLVVLLLAQAAGGRPAKVAAGATVRLFDTAASAQACTDATAADLAAELEAAANSGRRPVGSADEVCDAGTVVKLAPATLVRVTKTSGKLVSVTVEGGKNAGKRGWLWAGRIKDR